jgi:hypothetical protein
MEGQRNCIREELSRDSKPGFEGIITQVQAVVPPLV